MDAFLSDYEKVYDWVIENTGYTPSLFRFPGGSNNGSSYVVNEIIDELRLEGPSSKVRYAIFSVACSVSPEPKPSA